MDKERIFKDNGYRVETFNGFKIRELSLAQRRAIAEHKDDAPPEVIAALTVAMSCPDFTEDDVERLVDEVRPEILISAATRIYEISGMVEGVVDDAKKPSDSRTSDSRSGWLWRLGKLLHN